MDIDNNYVTNISIQEGNFNNSSGVGTGQSIFTVHIWAVACDFQQCDIKTSVDSDETVQPPFKL